MRRSRAEVLPSPTSLVSSPISQSIFTEFLNETHPLALHGDQNHDLGTGADAAGERGGACASGRVSAHNHGRPLQDISSARSGIDAQTRDDGSSAENAHHLKSPAAIAAPPASATTMSRSRYTRKHKPQPIDTSSLLGLSRAYASAYNAAVSPVQSLSDQPEHVRDTRENRVGHAESGGASREKRVKKSESSISSSPMSSPKKRSSAPSYEAVRAQCEIGCNDGEEAKDILSHEQVHEAERSSSKHKKADRGGDKGELKRGSLVWKVGWRRQTQAKQLDALSR